MQIALDFGQQDVFRELAARLRAHFGPTPLKQHLSPAHQLVRTMIRGRTKDAVSNAAHEQLLARFATPDAIADASEEEIELAIAPVMFAESKAKHLRATLRRLREQHGAITLDFLEDWSVSHALAYLHTLPGVKRKVAAAVLNFSTLRKPALVVDTHLLRVFKRLRLISPSIGDAEHAYDIVMPALAGWNSAETGELHVLLKWLGQRICTHTRPACASCPVYDLCAYKDVTSAPRPSAGPPCAMVGTVSSTPPR